MEDIVLNGVSITELKATKAAIQKDASKFIADGIEKVKALVGYIVQVYEDEEGVLAAAHSETEIEEFSKKALEILEAVSLVSDVSGVEYFLNYNDEYGSYDEVLSSMIEECEHLSFGDVNNSKLYDQLSDMEYNVKNWNASNC